MYTPRSSQLQSLIGFFVVVCHRAHVHVAKPWCAPEGVQPRAVVAVGGQFFKPGLWAPITMAPIVGEQTVHHSRLGRRLMAAVDGGVYPISVVVEIGRASGRERGETAVDDHE